MRQPLLILLVALGVGDPRVSRGDIAHLPHFWGPEKARVRQPLLIMFPFGGDQFRWCSLQCVLGILENAAVT